MTSLIETIENKNINIKATDHYAAILGVSPSKGARSPKLWNASFNGLRINALMHPLDITFSNLRIAVGKLKEDAAFIGGAVAMPYKIEILPFLDEIEREAQTIGAVNCLYKKNGQLVGANTDGEAALWSLERAYGGDIKGKTVLLIGTGGAGLAVATYLAKALGSGGRLILANRSDKSRDAIAAKLNKYCQINNIQHWPLKVEDIGGIDILVNCTSMGFHLPELEHLNPLGENADAILEAAARPFVFDIIYQPLETKLLSMARSKGCNTLNGLAMNLEQAVIAFHKATKSTGLFHGPLDKIRFYMESAC